jgi:hypothetical protein
MRSLAMILFLLALNAAAFSQKKVKLRYQYDVEQDVRTKKKKKELYKIYHYNRSGFLNRIITYGKTKRTFDTIQVRSEDGHEEQRIVARFSIDKKKTGRVETFTKINDSTISSQGYEIWFPQDTFHFKNTYLKIAPATYQIQSNSQLPPGFQRDVFCDEDFEGKYSENACARKYNANGQVGEVRYYNKDNAEDKMRIVGFQYDARGNLASDSTTADGVYLSKNMYQYNKHSKLISIENTHIRKSYIIRFEYNTDGHLIRKYVKNSWAIEYKYIYY